MNADRDGHPDGTAVLAPPVGDDELEHAGVVLAAAGGGAGVDVVFVFVALAGETREVGGERLAAGTDDLTDGHARQQTRELPAAQLRELGQRHLGVCTDEIEEDRALHVLHGLGHFPLETRHPVNIPASQGGLYGVVDPDRSVHIAHPG